VSDASKLAATSGWARAVALRSTPTRNRLAAGGQTKGASTEVGSAGSAPAMACSTSAQSSAERQRGPSLSSVQQRAMAPWRETRPYVGRRPDTPENDAGVRMEPDVSEPMAKATRPAPVAAADPLELPPLQWAGFQGDRPGPVKLASGLL